MRSQSTDAGSGFFVSADGVTFFHIGEHASRNAVSRQGMVMDFSLLKGIVNRDVVNAFDHAVVLNTKDPLSQQIKGSPTKINITQYQPTSENLLADFAGRIREALPPSVKLHSLKLRETATSYAEWFSEDNA